jgi:hypothetical protein
MNHPFTSQQSGVTRKLPEEQAADPRLRGGWLMLARTVWITLTVLTVIHFFASLQNYFILYQKICTSGGSIESGCVITPTNVGELQAMGLSVGFLAMYNTVLVVVAAVVFFAVGAVIFWRTWEKSTNLMALFVSLALITYAGAGEVGLLIASRQYHSPGKEWPPSWHFLLRYPSSSSFISFLMGGSCLAGRVRLRDCLLSW